MADKIKLALSLLFLVAGLVGFYLLTNQATILRVLSVLSGVLVAAAIGWKTTFGQQFALFANEAVIETKKVVWPTRKEAMQMTWVVFIFVVVMALLLFLADKGLEWALYDLVLGWSRS